MFKNIDIKTHVHARRVYQAWRIHLLFSGLACYGDQAVIKAYRWALSTALSGLAAKTIACQLDGEQTRTPCEPPDPPLNWLDLAETPPSPKTADAQEQWRTRWALNRDHLCQSKVNYGLTSSGNTSIHWLAKNLTTTDSYMEDASY